MNWLNPSTISTMIPLFALSIPIVAIIGGVVQRLQRESQLHETIRALAKAGQPIPPELLRGKAQRDVEIYSTSTQVAARPGARSLRSGLFFGALGLGIACTFYLIMPDSMYWAWGFIPLFLGIAYLLVWKIESGPPAA